MSDLLKELKAVTKQINEIFVEASLHRTEWARVHRGLKVTPTADAQQEFDQQFRQWFNNAVKTTIKNLPGPQQSLGCYVLKEHLQRFPLFDPGWTPPFPRTSTVLEKFIASRSPVLLAQLPDLTTLLIEHPTSATADEKQTVAQWQAALNEWSKDLLIKPSTPRA